MERRHDDMGNRIYEEFEPIARWSSEPGFDILTVYLPGFRKEQLKVQATSTRKLRVIGERPTEGNKWIRFHKEFPIQPNTDVDTISAKFEGVNLVVKLPRPEKKGKPAYQKPAAEKEQKQPLAAEKEEASRGGEKVHPLKPAAEKPAEKKEEASRRAEKVHRPKPALEKPAEKEEATGGAEKVRPLKPMMEKPGKKEEEAPRETEKVHSPKPAVEKLAEKKGRASRGAEKVRPKENVCDGVQNYACKVRSFKQVLGGFVRDMKDNERVTVGVVVAAAVVLLAVGIYAGKRLKCSYGDLQG